MSHVVYTELKKLQLENTKIWVSWAWFFAVMAPPELIKIKGPTWDIGSNVIEHSIPYPGFNIRVEIYQLNCEGKIFNISKVHRSQVQPLARILQ